MSFRLEIKKMQLKNNFFNNLRLTLQKANLSKILLFNLLLLNYINYIYQKI